MSISVILCTYNRCESLKTTLDSLTALVVPQSIEWEVLVVDNNSKDRTREVINEFCLRNPGRFRYISELKQGLSNARNAGIGQARGEILAFVDDDVTVEPGWLHDLTANLYDGQWSGAGGRILPPTEFAPPPWLELRGPWGQGGPLCAQFDFGDTPGELKEEPPYGTNMAFRKTMFEKYGGFRVDMGRCGGSLIGNEDTEFGRRLMAAGERLRYEPSAIVYHSIAEERLNKKYFWVYWFAFGRAQMREKGLRTKVWGIPRYFFSLPNIALRILLPEVVKWLLTRDPRERFSRQCRAWCTAGTLAEVWDQALRGSFARSGNSLPQSGDIS
jgi:glycosyltransferase involved in cell wall biosynthesis